MINLLTLLLSCKACEVKKPEPNPDTKEETKVDVYCVDAEVGGKMFCYTDKYLEGE